MIEHNRQGHAIIHLRSIERNSDPFIQLLIDLAWAKGQIYREYDVLLDPPDYQLAFKKHNQTHRVKHTPSRATVERQGTQEVDAHDEAWQLKQPIQHDLSHPSASQSDVKIESQIPSAPVLARSGQLSKQYLSAIQDSLSPTQPETSHLEGVGSALKAQMDLTVQAIDSLRESNALLKEQLHSMQNQNQILQGQLKQRDTEMKHMQAQIELRIRRQGVAGQVIQPSDDTQHGGWLWVLILLGAAAGGTYVAWRKWGFPDVEKAYQFVQSRMKPKVKVKAEGSESETIAKTEVVSEPAEPVIVIKESAPMQSVEPPVEPEVVSKEDVVEATLDLADSTETDVKNVADTKKISLKKSKKEDVPTHNLIEFEAVSPPVEEPLKPVRSKSALDTLLTLTQTYIEMGDTAAAHESLKEVLEYGNKKQQDAAEKLIKVLVSK